MNVTKILEGIKTGSISIEEGEEIFKKLPYEDLGYAKLDHHRELRAGIGEVIFCSGKADQHLLGIFKSLLEEKENILGTRATKEQYEFLKKEIPELQFDPISRILKVEFEKEESLKKEAIGNIVVCTAGTADIAVAEEASQTAEFFGGRVQRIYDVGVAGIHRLLLRTEELRAANCIIAIAGMEGALGSVVAGLVDKPVIAVPTSVGYGASFGGIAALLTMINSCANGIAVVNIDNGYGAAYMATQINRLAVKKDE
ncbi:MAG: nickel pincer cofactor biosynthesis protein LarB [Acetivibrio sp.]